MKCSMKDNFSQVQSEESALYNEKFLHTTNLNLFAFTASIKAVLVILILSYFRSHDLKLKTLVTEQFLNKLNHLNRAFTAAVYK